MSAIINSITQLDLDILLYIQDNLRFDFLTPIMKFITMLGDKGIFWLALAVILLIPEKTRRSGAMAIISIGIGFVVANLILKNAVARIRPYEVEPALQLLVAKAHDFSFPSGHACCSFASAMIYVRTLKKPWGVLTMILAILIAYSRLYVGIHYPSDVIVGILVGIVSGVVTFELFRLSGRGSSSRKR